MRPSIRDIQNLIPDCTYRVDFGLLGLERFVEQYHINLDPDYQRGHVWTSKQKQQFVGFAIQNHRAVPTFWFNWRRRCPTKPVEVVDGKQRMTAILDWTVGKFEAITPSGYSIHVNSLNEIERRQLEMTTTLSMHFLDLPRKDILQFYLSLNSAGTRHTSKELDRVRGLLASAK